MRDLINLISLLEAVDTKETNPVRLKKTIIDLIKTTEEGTVLNQVLKVLQSGNIDERIANVVNTDADAKQFLGQITDAIVKSDASIEQKNAFLEKFPKGILNAKKLIDGKEHSFEELVGPGFPTELLKNLSTQLTSQGVGPGEVALAIMSPNIKWSGREAGGGDILVYGKPIEVKTRVNSGGRWLNARKANMNLPAIKDAIEDASGVQVPARLGVNDWVNVYRPSIDPKQLPSVAQTIANGIFTGVNNKQYVKALIKGDAQDIIDEHLRTGFDNYKKLSGFEGILMIDLPTERTQYFQDYDSMANLIKNSTIYLYAPESEMMPKVELAAGSTGQAASGNKIQPTATATTGRTSKDEFADVAAQIANGSSPKANTGDKSGGVGRTKRR